MDPSSNGTGTLIAPGSAADSTQDPQSGDIDLSLPKRPPPPVQGATFVASQRDPVRWARVMDLAKRLQIQPDFVDRNFDELSKADQQHQAAQATSNVSPTMANWLSNPDNATIGKHEIAPLSRIDKGSKIIAGHPTEPEPPAQPGAPSGMNAVSRAATTGWNDLTSSAWQLAAAYGMATPALAAQHAADANKEAADLRSQMPDYAKQYAAAMEHAKGDVDQAFQGMLDSRGVTQREGVLAGLKAYASGGIKTVGGALDVIRAYATHPLGAGYSAIEGLATMLPALITAKAGAVAGAASGAAIGAGVGGIIGSPTVVGEVGTVPAGAVVGGAIGGIAGMASGTFLGMAPVAVGGEINAELQKRGYDITSSADLLRAYSDPSLMAEIRAKAERKGLTTAAVIAAFSTVAGKFSTGASEAGAVVKAGAGAADVGVQAGGMSAADLAGQVAAEKGDLKKVSVGQAAESGLSMLGYSIGEAAIGHSLGLSRRAAQAIDPATAAVEVTTKAYDAIRAQRDAQALSEIGTAIKEAKTTASVPDRVKQLVETATGGEDASSVYFQDGDWDKYWQSKGASPAKAAADIMGDQGKAYYESKTTGAPIAIPLGDYVSKVGPTEHFEGLLDVARTKPDGMSLGEAHEYLQALPATMAELAKEATTEKAPAQVEPGPEASAAKVRENVEGQLKDAGVAPGVAKTQSSLYESAFRAFGERSGVDPLELFNRYMLRIRGENAPGGAPAEPPSPEKVAAQGAAPSAGAYSADHVMKTLHAADAAVEAGLSFDQFTQKHPEMKGLVDPSWFTKRTGARTESNRAANVDDLTGVSNARAFRRALPAAEADPNTAIVRFDMNGFKSVNDVHGHGAGDEALQNTAQVMEHVAATMGIEPKNFRVGGDEFASIVPAEKADAFRAAVEETVGVKDLGRGVKYSISGGAGQTNEIADAAAMAQKIVHKGVQGIAARGSGEAQVAPPDILTLHQDERGRITLGEHGVEITLLAQADRSTFLHETAHFYLEVLGDLATAEKAEPGISKDYAAVTDWLGVENRSQIGKEQHEQFARGFEAYLMEGKAPSAGLRDAFYRMKRWLVSLYKDVRSLNVELSPEIRGVFDRLLASDDEIKSAESSGEVKPLFDNPAAFGMGEKKAAEYANAVHDAHQSAEEELTKEMMREVRREESADWRAKREPVRAEIEKTVNKEPVYKALEYLKKGKQPDGTAMPEGTPELKLDRAMVKEQLGEDLASRLPRGTTATPEKGGTDPNVIAEMFGFESGRKLVEMISQAPDRSKLINRQTDQKMRDLYGERLSEDEIQAKAQAAVRGEKRSLLVRRELEYMVSDHFAQFKGLVKRITSPIPSEDAVRADAEKLVGAKTIRELVPRTYELAAARAAKDARDALLRGEFEQAIAAKRKELLVTEIFRAAKEAREAVDESLDSFKKVFGHDDRLAESRNMDMVNGARAVLASFGIGKSDKPPEAFLKQMKDYDPSMYEVISPLVEDATQGATNYKNLTYQDFTTLKEAVSGMWDLSRRTEQVEVAGKLMARRELQGKMAEQIGVTTGQRPVRQGYEKARTKWDTGKRTLQSAKGWLTRAEHLSDYLDGDNPERPFTHFLFGPVSDGATEYRVQEEAELKKYAEVVKRLVDVQKFKDVEAPELHYVFKDKNELWGALLHTGNESNLQKMIRGRGWGQMEDHTIGASKTVSLLDASRWKAFEARMRSEGKLPKEAYDWAQSVWDQFETLKPDAQRAHKEMYGRYFSEITAHPFKNEFGSYRGGYYPAIADPFLVPKAREYEDMDAMFGSQNSFMFPSTFTGFTKSRVEAYAKPLIMDASLVPSHMSGVLRFIHIQPRVRDVARMVLSPAFRPHLDELDPTLTETTLRPWLQRAAAQRMEEPGKWKPLDTFARELRNRSGLQIMFANATVLAEQITHFPSVIVKVDAGRVLTAFGRYIKSPSEFAADVNAKSDMMATRQSAAMMEAKSSIRKIMLDPSLAQEGNRWIQEHGRFLMTAVQSVMDHATWGAAYDKATTSTGLGGLGFEEDEAIRHADGVVRMALGSYNPEDVSRIEAGTPFQRLFTMFSGFYNTKANMLGGEFAKTIRDQGLRGGAGRLLYVYTFGFLAAALAGGAIRQTMSGQPLDPDGDGPTDDLLRLFFGSQVEMAGSAIPIVGRPLASAAVHVMEGKKPQLDVLSSPAIKSIEDAFSGATVAPYHAIHDHIVNRKDINDVMTLLGLLTNTPGRTIAKPLEYLHDVHEGKKAPRNRADLFRGLLTGQ